MRNLILYEKNGDNAIYKNHKGKFYKILGFKYKMINNKKELCVVFEPFTYKIKDCFFVKPLNDFLDIIYLDNRQQYEFIHISEIKSKEEQRKYKNELLEIVQFKKEKNNFKNK